MPSISIGGKPKKSVDTIGDTAEIQNRSERDRSASFTQQESEKDADKVSHTHEKIFQNLRSPMPSMQRSPDYRDGTSLSPGMFMRE